MLTSCATTRPEAGDHDDAEPADPAAHQPASRFVDDPITAEHGRRQGPANGFMPAPPPGCVAHPRCHQRRDRSRCRDPTSATADTRRPVRSRGSRHGPVPRCRLICVGRPLLPPCLPAHRAAPARWRADRRGGTAPAAPRPERSDVRRRAPRLSLPASLAAAAAALGLTTTLQAAPVAQAAEVAHAAGFTANQKWSQTLNDAGNPIALSSPNVANLDGQPSVVVGDRGRQGVRLPPQRRIGAWPAGPTTPARRSTPRRRWRRSTPTALDTVYVGGGNAASPPRAATRPSPPRGRPVVRPGDQPRDRPHAALRASRRR